MRRLVISRVMDHLQSQTSDIPNRYRDDPKTRFVCYKVLNHSFRFQHNIGQEE